MEEKIRRAIEKYHMLGTEDNILVAFSGGADSLALLHYLAGRYSGVSAVHVNHMIRGAESDTDESFCRHFCKEHNIAFYSHRIDVPREAMKSGEGTEEAARRLRYQAIEKTAKKIGACRVATAHHADDNAETLIFNIVRGSAGRGACGIPPVRGIYIRPLIFATRREILDYCAANGLSYVTDATNADTDYTRNYIRHEIMPRLALVNPRADEAITRFCENARRDNDYLDAQASKISEDANRQELARLDDAVLSRVIRARCEKQGVIPCNNTLVCAMEVIRDGNEFHTLDLGGALTLTLDRGTVSVGSRIENVRPVKTVLENEITVVPGFGTFYLGKSRASSKELINIYKLSIYTELNSDKIKSNVFVRSREEGDRYRYKGMTHTVKKLFNSRRIPVNQRDSIALVCDDDGILWIPGFPPRDDTAADTNTENILFLGYNKNI